MKLSKNKILFLSFLSIMFWSCNKEEIKVVNKELDINPTSIDYQRHISERAITYIKVYRFEKAEELMDKIEDKEILKRMKQTLKEYKSKALKDAFYFITPDKDTIFYRDREYSVTSPGERKKMQMFFGSPELYVANRKGTLYGFEYYPNIEELYISNCLAENIVGFESLKNLKKFSWVSDKEFFDMMGEKVRPHIINADLSKNKNLTTVFLQNVDIDNLLLPKVKFEKFIIRGNYNKANSEKLQGIETSVFTFDNMENNTDLLNSVRADTLELKNYEVPSGTLNYTGKDVSTLVYRDRYNKNPLINVDLSNSGLQDLSLMVGEKTEEIKLNPQLKKVDIYVNTSDPNQRITLKGLDNNPNLKFLSLGLSSFRLNLADLPKDIEELHLSSMTDEPDFSHFNELNHLFFSTDLKSKIKLPKKLKVLEAYLYRSDTGELVDLDLTNSTLEKISFTFASPLTEVTTPSTLEEFNISTAENLTKLDLSNSSNLKKLEISAYTVKTKVILPKDLRQEQFEEYPMIILKQGSEVVNKPDWLTIDEY